MKFRYFNRLFFILPISLASSLNIQGQTPEFTYNGSADVIFKYPPRGSGGRAIVHADGNILSLNFEGDFTGGTSIGDNFNIFNDGRAYFTSWTPRGSYQNDFYIDVEPGTRLLRTRNWNIENPNIASTGIHTGSGYFEASVGIGTTSPSAPLTVYGVSNFYPKRVGGGDVRSFSINSSLSNPGFISNDYPIILSTGGGNQPLIFDAARIGVGTGNPDERLTVKGKIHAEEVRIDLAVPGPDYVFNTNYQLSTLASLQKFIQDFKHLPEVPSAKEMKENGINLGEINILLLKKIEELTLYLINQNEQILKLEEVNKKQDQSISKLLKRK